MESNNAIRTIELGHAVLYVTNLEIMADFYSRILGFPMIQKMHGAAVFGGGRTHHELLLIEVGGQPQVPGKVRPGLYHLGFKIGTSDEELKAAIQVCKKEGVTILGASDHTVTHSLYIADPDGNELELYVDVTDAWKEEPSLILSPTKRLILD